MELVREYQRLYNWDKKKVNYLPGAYAVALKKLYGDKYVHVDLYKNKRVCEARRTGEVITYGSEVV